jgi:twitching motility protein PilT
MALINQREIRSDTESFATGLRAALREDPDVILVGEMNDAEAVSAVLETAESGHLVLGALHMSTSVGAIDRLVDQFPTDRQAQARIMLSSVLKGVVAQTLCKKIGGGRVAALEILVALQPVSNLIREGKTFQISSMMQTGKASGMQTLNDALLALVQEGAVEPDEALRRAVARSDLRVMLEVAGYRAG